MLIYSYIESDISEELKKEGIQAFEKILLSKNLTMDNLITNKGSYALIQALCNPQIHTLDLSYSYVGEHAVALAKALCHTQAHTLNLRCTFINEHAVAMLQAFHHTQVHTLNLSCNNFGKYAVTIAQALHHTQVHTLDLSYNSIGEHVPAMVQALHNTRVHTLILKENHIGEHAAAMAQALCHTQVQTLIVSENHLGEHAVAMAQALCATSLRKLDLAYNDAQEYALAIVQALCNAQVYILLLDAVPENTLQFVKALSKTKITTLGLDFNAVDLHVALKFFKSLQETKLNTLYVRKLLCLRGLGHEIHKLHEPLRKSLATTSICFMKGAEYLPGIEAVILENRRRVYVQRLHIAEYHGAFLKELFQKVFPENDRPFPPSIAYRIMKFMGYNNDKNLEKRFLDKLKPNAFFTSPLLVDASSGHSTSMHSLKRKMLKLFKG